MSFFGIGKKKGTGKELIDYANDDVNFNGGNDNNFSNVKEVKQPEQKNDNVKLNAEESLKKMLGVDTEDNSESNTTDNQVIKNDKETVTKNGDVITLTRVEKETLDNGDKTPVREIVKDNYDGTKVLGADETNTGKDAKPLAENSNNTDSKTVKLPEVNTDDSDNKTTTKQVAEQKDETPIAPKITSSAHKPDNVTPIAEEKNTIKHIAEDNVKDFLAKVSNQNIFSVDTAFVDWFINDLNIDENSDSLVNHKMLAINQLTRAYIKIYVNKAQQKEYNAFMAHGTKEDKDKYNKYLELLNSDKPQQEVQKEIEDLNLPDKFKRIRSVKNADGLDNGGFLTVYHEYIFDNIDLLLSATLFFNGSQNDATKSNWKETNTESYLNKLIVMSTKGQAYIDKYHSSYSDAIKRVIKGIEDNDISLGYVK